MTPPKKSFDWPTDLVFERIKYLDLLEIQLRTLQEITELVSVINTYTQFFYERTALNKRLV